MEKELSGLASQQTSATISSTSPNWPMGRDWQVGLGGVVAEVEPDSQELADASDRRAKTYIRVNDRQAVRRDSGEFRKRLAGEGRRSNFVDDPGEVPDLVALGPIGLAGMNARRGEVQAARAAAGAGVPFTLSTVSVCSLKEVSAETPAPFRFQLYMIRDRGFMRDLLRKAQAHGCPALVFTVDMPVPGSRYRHYRSGLAGAPGAVGGIRRAFQAIQHPAWAWDVGLRGRPHQLGNIAPVLGRKAGLEDFFRWMRENFDPSIGWRDLEEVRSAWSGPLILKGILDAEDARNAVSLGADGIVVSNHGGRQLDGVQSTAAALPRIAEAVGDRLTVLADGGVRSGLDVVRLLALGARGVLPGRAWAYALAAAGEQGVARMLNIVEAEMRVAMISVGEPRSVGACSPPRAWPGLAKSGHAGGKTAMRNSDFCRTLGMWAFRC